MESAIEKLKNDIEKQCSKTKRVLRELSYIKQYGRNYFHNSSTAKTIEESIYAMEKQYPTIPVYDEIRSDIIKCSKCGNSLYYPENPTERIMLTFSKYCVSYGQRLDWRNFDFSKIK